MFRKGRLLSILLFMVLGCSSGTVNKLDLFNTQKINYFGRNVITSEQVSLYNTGSGFEFCFYGDKCTAKFASGYKQKIKIYLDGEDKGTKYVSSSVELCSNIPLAKHTLKVIKVNSEQFGEIKLTSIEGASTYEDAPIRRKYKFEFYGDSITAGYGINNNWNETNLENEDGTKTYAYLTSEHFNAEANYLCYSGVSLILPNWIDWTLLERYDQYSLDTNTNKWDFNNYQPDYLIVNIGTNDGSIVNANTAPRFSEGCETFLSLLREKYPHTPIIYAYGMMGVNPLISNGVKAAINRLNDANIHYFEMNKVDCSAILDHPSADGHIDGANQLINFLTQLMDK